MGPGGGGGRRARRRRRADADELIAHAAASIARYKLPKAVVFRPVIERSPAGKADYRWAREQAVKAALEPTARAAARHPQAIAVVIASTGENGGAAVPVMLNGRSVPTTVR